MRIDLDLIEIENFKSFRRARLVFSDLGPGLHFVRGSNLQHERLGSNGAGKSTLLDATCWVLYGSTPDGLRGTDLRPWGAPRDTTTHVALWLLVDDVRHEIRRTHNPNRLLLDGNDATGEEVVRLVGLSRAAFLYTQLISQHQPLFLELPASEKMNLLSEVLAHDRWERRAAAAATAARAAEVSAIETRALITGTEGNITRTDALHAAARTQMQLWETHRAERAAARSRQVEELRARVDALELRSGEYQLALDSAATELRALVDGAGALREATARARHALAESTAHAAAATREVAALRRQLSETSSLSDGMTCPTCGSRASARTLTRYRARVEQMLSDAQARSVVPDELYSRVIETANAEMAADGHADGFRASARRARDDLDAVTPRLADARAGLAAGEEAARSEGEEVNPHRQQVQDLRRWCEQLKADLCVLRERLAALEAEQATGTTWSRGFRDVRLYLVEECLAELELSVAEMLEEVGLAGWSLRFVVERESRSGTTQRKLAAMIRVPESPEEVRWESWSGGERQRLRLVVSRALARVLLNHAGVEFGCEMLDEPSQHVADGGVQDIIDMLAEQARRAGTQIIYIDHRVAESARFSSVIEVVKDDSGSSSIRQEGR